MLVDCLVETIESVSAAENALDTLQAWVLVRNLLCSFVFALKIVAVAAFVPCGN